MHRLLALRPRLRGSARHLRADDFRPRLRQPRLARHERELSRLRMRLLRRLRAGLPDRDADRKIRDRDRPARAFGGHHLRLLRRRLHLQGGNARRGSRAHGAVQGRQGQSRPFLRQGPLRLGLHHPQGTHPQADDPREASPIPGAKCRGTRRSTLPPPSSRASRHKYGRDAVGGITSSRCTNEETYLVQKLIRAGFGNNNVDTCARVCHSPTGYGLSTTFGTSAGTQDFDSVEHTDVVMVIGANPAAAHPVFASRMKKRLRQGAKLIVIDPRRTEMVESPHVKALHHLPLMPGTNVAVLTALAHVIVTEGLVDEAFVRERCDWSEFEDWAAFVALPKNSPEATAIMTGVDPEGAARRGAAVRHRRQWRDLLRPRRHRAQPGLDHGDRDRQPCDGDRQYRPSRRRREPAARPEQRAGLLRHGLVPARAARLSPHRGRRGARSVRSDVERQAQPGAGPAHSQHVRCRDRRHLHGPLRAGRGHPAVRSQHQACGGGAVGDGMRHRPRSLPQRDRELRPRLPAGLDLPREGRHLHQRRTAHPARPQGDDAAQRLCRLGSHDRARQGDGLSRCTTTIRPRSWTRSRR